VQLVRGKRACSTRQDELEIIIADPFQAGNLSFKLTVLHHIGEVKEAKGS